MARFIIDDENISIDNLDMLKKLEQKEWRAGGNTPKRSCAGRGEEVKGQDR